MPEGPEAKVIARELRVLVGNTIEQVIIKSGDKFDKMEDVEGRRVEELFSVGKKVIMRLDEGYIVTSLGMTGKWCLYKPDYQPLLTIKMDNETVAYFIDSRKFGNVCYVNCNELNEIYDQLGPDLLNEEVTLSQWQKIFIGRRKICDFLIDQKKIAGIGNYLRCEILYDAKGDPFTKVNELTAEEIDALYYSTIKIMKASYRSGGLSIGNTIGNYLSPRGVAGTYPTLVYNRTETAQGETVLKDKNNGQTVWYTQQQCEYR